MAISIPYCYLVRPKVVTFFIKIILSGIISKVCLATTSNKLERPLNRDDEISSVPLSVKPRLPHGMPHWWSFLSLFSREQEGGLAIRAAFQNKTKLKKKVKQNKKQLHNMPNACWRRIVSSGFGGVVCVWVCNTCTIVILDHVLQPVRRQWLMFTVYDSLQQAIHIGGIPLCAHFWMNFVSQINVEYRQQT